MWYINKNTATHSGGGLPVTTKTDYLFTVRSENKYITSRGFWRVPSGKLPTFQIFVQEDTLISSNLFITNGGANFTGVINIPAAAFTVNPIEKNGVNFWVWSTNDSYTLSSAVEGRYLINFVLQNSTTSKQSTYYTEEFIISDCC
tara:strand:- start:476 stop:910 length:435 start_codon:yes stop_codon:yes gene_type:complete